MSTHLLIGERFKFRGERYEILDVFEELVEAVPIADTTLTYISFHPVDRVLNWLEVDEEIELKTVEWSA